jgi:thioredoxin reductase (NADPH)
MSSSFDTDIVVIGAGPVGLFSVFEAGSLKMKCHVIDILEFTGGQCSALYPEKPIYDIPAHPAISAADLVEKLETQIEPFKPTFHLGHKVIKLIKDENGVFTVETDKGIKVTAKAVIIAAGCGAFGPNRPPLENIEEFENTGSVKYLVNKISDFQGKKVAIAGGGDSAIDWALSLSEVTKKLTLIHRRAKFRAAPHSLEKLDKLIASGKVELAVPYQLSSLKGDGGKLSAVEVADLKGNKKDIDAEILLPFYGLRMELGPIADWNLNIVNNHIAVTQSTMETNVPGIFAIGDIAHYENKLKLILSGFAEAASACYKAYNYVYPDKALHFEYSTTKFA